MNALTRRKVISHVPEAAGAASGSGRLARTLSWPHLVALGVGAIVGTGIYTLIGVGAGLAGPAVLLSFAIAGAITACAALCYAEMATTMPQAGSAYTYSYAVLGEGLAWVIGWSLILEYSLVVAAVAVGWSGYAVGFLNGLGVRLPLAVTAGPHAGGVVNLPAVAIIAAVAALLCAGTRESATLNAALVAVKMAALLIFVAVALPHFDAANFQPFMPFGFAAQTGADGVARGVMAAAAIIFFAFYGFDAISTAAEDAKDPARDLSIGIVGSMAACTLIYIAVAAAAVGAMAPARFAASPEPLALIMRDLGSGALAGVVAAAAVAALPTVLLAFLFGQSRIFFAMARDGLLPQTLARVSRRGAPVRVTLLTAVLVAALAGVARLDEIAALANAGTLAAFVAVAACLLLLRRREPDRPRRFRTPAAWLVAPVAILGCLYLFWSLPANTKLWFLAWNALGVVVYLGYGIRRSRLARPSAETR